MTAQPDDLALSLSGVTPRAALDLVEASTSRYPTLEGLQRAFLAWLGRGRAERTLLSYETGLRRFGEFLGEAGVHPFEDTAERLPTDVLEAFTAYMSVRRPQLSRASVDLYVAAVLAYFRFGIRRGLVPPRFVYENMRDNVRDGQGRRGNYRVPRIDRRLPLVVVSAEQLPLPDARAIGHRNQRLTLLRDRAILRTLFCSGMRRAEVVSLNRADIDDGWLDQAPIVGKGNKERVVFFDEDTLAAVRAYLVERADELEPLFLRHDNRRRAPGVHGENWRLSPQGLWAIVKHYAALSGVSATTHHFRHAKARTLLNRGANLSEVQDLLGHASPNTTKLIYARYETSTLRRAFTEYSASLDQLVTELAAEEWRRRDPTPTRSRPDDNSRRRASV